MARDDRPATFDEDIRDSEDERFLEIHDGVLVRRAMPSFEHSAVSARIGGVAGPFNRPVGTQKGPGGWWLHVGVHVAYSEEVFVHDAAGWRRDLPVRPSGWPTRERPDWVCEIVSIGREDTDLITKPRVLHAAGVPHYWVLDPVARTLLVHRWSEAGYVIVQRAAAGEMVRAEPFDAIEIAVDELFGE